MGFRGRMLGLMLVLGAAATPVAAQEKRVDIGVFGGGSFPTQDAANLYKIGYTVGGTVRYWPESWPFGLQFDGQFMTYARKDANTFDGGLDIIGGTVGLAFALFPETSAVVPYLLIGGGGYNLKAQKPIAGAPDSARYGSQTKPGVVLGGGFEYRTYTARLVPYIDLRMIGIFGSDPRETAYINFVAGLKYVLGGKKPR